MRDIEQYDVFLLAHEALLQAYASSKNFPVEERYALASQLRRAAYSITSNLIEGAARSSEKDFKHFVNMAYGSSAEVKYLVRLAQELGYISHDEAVVYREKYDRIQQMLFKLQESLKPEHNG